MPNYKSKRASADKETVTVSLSALARLLARQAAAEMMAAVQLSSASPKTEGETHDAPTTTNSP